MPALFIRLPARMKNGTASSGKLSMPPTIRWMTTKGGRLPETRMNASDAPAIAMATGIPLLMKSRKKIFSMKGRSVVVEGRHRPPEDAPAAPPVHERDLERAERHRREAEQDDAVDEVHRRI